MKFLFGDIVVVEDNLIGVIVKSWESLKHGNYYEVYVRNYNGIKEYDEKDIERYKVRHKELNEEEMYYQNMQGKKMKQLTEEEQAFIQGTEFALDCGLSIPDEDLEKYNELINNN